MAGLAEFALAGAPVAGGALLALAAGNIKGPDIRGSIKADMELLAALPPEQVERRAALQRSIDMRIDDIVSAVEKNGRSGSSPPPTAATGAMSWCSSARCCSPWCGGTSVTTAPTG
jgi:hypothetical protein